MILGSLMLLVPTGTANEEGPCEGSVTVTDPRGDVTPWADPLPYERGALDFLSASLGYGNGSAVFSITLDAAPPSDRQREVFRYWFRFFVRNPSTEDQFTVGLTIGTSPKDPRYDRGYLDWSRDSGSEASDYVELATDHPVTWKGSTASFTVPEAMLRDIGGPAFEIGSPRAKNDGPHYADHQGGMPHRDIIGSPFVFTPLEQCRRDADERAEPLEAPPSPERPPIAERAVSVPGLSATLALLIAAGVVERIRGRGT